MEIKKASDYYEALASALAKADWVDENGGIEAIEVRMMPEGYRWPRFEDDEPVLIGDKVSFGDDGGAVSSIELQDEEYFLLHACDGAGRCSQRHFSPGERVKRPPVLAADGEPLEVGQTVWNINGGGPYTVTEVDRDHMHVGVTCNTHDGKLDWGFEAAFLTHAKPEPPDKTCEDCAYFAKDPNAGTMGVCFAKAVRYGSNKFAYKFTCRWNPTCEKYEESGER